MSLILRINPLSCLRLGLQKQCLASRQLCTTPKRFSLNNRLRRIGSSSERERIFKEKDRIPKEYELIYRATAGTYLASAKYCVILSTIGVVTLAAWQLLAEGNIVPSLAPELIYGGLVVKESDVMFFAAGFVAINIAFNAIVKRFPLRIYNNMEKYIAVYESQLPFRSVQQHSFLKGQVSEKQPLLNPWKDSYFRIGNRSSLLFSYYFRTPADMNNMF